MASCLPCDLGFDEGCMTCGGEMRRVYVPPELGFFFFGRKECLLASPSMRHRTISLLPVKPHWMSGPGYQGRPAAFIDVARFPASAWNFVREHCILLHHRCWPLPYRVPFRLCKQLVPY
jgi:hypothetical protein